MKRTWHDIAVPVVLVLRAAIGIARPNGSPASRTRAAAVGGAAAEASCADCHADFAVNGGGSVSVLGVPALFRGGGKHGLTVHLASTQTAGLSGKNSGFPGLVGDGDGSEAGDWVSTGSAASTDTVTAAIPRTWGAVKSSYLKWGPHGVPRHFVSEGVRSTKPCSFSSSRPFR